LSFRDAIEYLGRDGEAPVQCHGAVTLVSLPECEPNDTIPLRRELAQRIWSEAVDPRGTIVERYLAVRGVRLPDANVLRFHPHCPRKGGNLPAMVALMSEPVTNEFRAVHRTFLLPDGSGKAKDLQDIGMGLGLAEGIETALSVSQTVGWGPVWAAGSAGAIRTFPYMRATALNVFSDGDPVGLVAARACAERWAAAGAEVLIHTPPAGKDWNDVAWEILA
jgi:putative DNA primase/helicase